LTHLPSVNPPIGEDTEENFQKFPPSIVTNSKFSIVNNIH
jgi:hypothetical protein